MKSAVCPRCGSADVTCHFTPYPKEFMWDSRRSEAYRCPACGLFEECDSDAKEYGAWRERWKDINVPLSAAQENAERSARQQKAEEWERAWKWPDERLRTTRAKRDAWESRESYAKLLRGLPRNAELEAAIMAAPDDDTPRLALASWLRTQPHAEGVIFAEFIEKQIAVARGFRLDPMRTWTNADSPYLPVTERHWWMAEPYGVELPRHLVDMLEGQGVIDHVHVWRGFVDHVAIRAKTFLEVADELYERAPLRQLAITFCKGDNHDDPGVLRALLQSPHLERIRSLELPARDKNKPLARFNRITDGDLELIAASPRLRNLAYLDVPDASVTIAGMHALADTKHLVHLDLVRLDSYRYHRRVESTWGGLGDHLATPEDSLLAAWQPELEAAHGRVEWLHVRDRYGSDDPGIEPVIEHALARPRHVT